MKQKLASDRHEHTGTDHSLMSELTVQWVSTDEVP